MKMAVIDANDLTDRAEAADLLTTGAAAWFTYETDRIKTELTAAFASQPAKLAEILRAIDRQRHLAEESAAQMIALVRHAGEIS
jgi:hypothetical protein